MATEWREEFNLGIPQIDVQHREYVALVAKIERHVGMGSDSTHLEQLFRDVEAYVQIHFATEETLFDRFGCYPHAAVHKEAHGRFVAAVAGLRAEFERDPGTVAGEAATVLQQWLYDHILLMDKGYVSCFKKSGL